MRLLSEERLSPREDVKLCLAASFAIFILKKNENGGERVALYYIHFSAYFVLNSIDYQALIPVFL